MTQTIVDKIHHLSSVEKTVAIVMLAEALSAATLVGNPAPKVQRLRAWMDAPLQIGDLVVEMSTKHRGPSPLRVGTVNDIRYNRRHRDPIVEILTIDAPCGNATCVDRKCIHRPRWNNAAFVRIPVTGAQLDEALGKRSGGADREGLVNLLTDAGFALKDQP